MRFLIWIITIMQCVVNSTYSVLQDNTKRAQQADAFQNTETGQKNAINICGEKTLPDDELTYCNYY